MPLWIGWYSVGTQIVGWVAIVSETHGELYEQHGFFIPQIEPITLGSCVLRHGEVQYGRDLQTANIVISFVLPHIVATLELNLSTSLETARTQVRTRAASKIYS